MTVPGSTRIGYHEYVGFMGTLFLTREKEGPCRSMSMNATIAVRSLKSLSFQEGRCRRNAPPAEAKRPEGCSQGSLHRPAPLARCPVARRRIAAAAVAAVRWAATFNGPAGPHRFMAGFAPKTGFSPQICHTARSAIRAVRHFSILILVVRARFILLGD